ncbi:MULTISPECIES: 3'-5' exonuclease [unclassified Bradyrhizobium]|uniref:3'-5' exonuclease n=1 Tax=unclassified Bradyrhizobium TaxID=2631580 RepID=UPI001BD0BDD5|nr:MULTISPECIES: 3'-5' exonuclease [unclassified Bradyrhizobium]WOH52967.1 3'-5' exonuclease [Bradyrhizobium sp. sBnM-33]
MTVKREIFISIDVEAAGPIPGEFSLLSIGACDVDEPSRVFSCELQPINRNADPKALEVGGFSLEKLARTGLPPKEAMEKFASWIESFVGESDTAVFVGFNAPFDWSFINYYFHKFLGRNPFGFTALDIKAYYMGATGSTWRDTRSSAIDAKLNPKSKSDHNALHDAQYQAELFRLIRKNLVSGRAGNA